MASFWPKSAVGRVAASIVLLFGGAGAGLAMFAPPIQSQTAVSRKGAPASPVSHALDLCVPNTSLPRVPGPAPTVWCTIEADNGSALSIDKGSIEKSGNYGDPAADAIIRMQPSGPDTLGQLMTVRFICRKKVAQVLAADYGAGSVSPAPPRSILGIALEIACSVAPNITQYPRHTVTQTDISNTCNINGLSGEACARVKTVASGPKPGYCKPGWGRIDSGLANEQRAICSLSREYETSRAPAIPGYCQPGWGLPDSGLTDEQKAVCERVLQ